jgi:hypothetical protein
VIVSLDGYILEVNHVVVGIDAGNAGSIVLSCSHKLHASPNFPSKPINGNKCKNFPLVISCHFPCNTSQVKPQINHGTYDNLKTISK